MDTLHRLQEAYPEARLVYLMGGDSLHDLPTWYHPQELVDACANLGIMRRVGDEILMKDGTTIKVVGVLERIGSQDDGTTFMPLATVQKLFKQHLK